MKLIIKEQRLIKIVCQLTGEVDQVLKSISLFNDKEVVYHGNGYYRLSNNGKNITDKLAFYSPEGNTRQKGMFVRMNIKMVSCNDCINKDCFHRNKAGFNENDKYTTTKGCTGGKMK